MRRFKRLSFITIIKTQLRSLKTLNIIIISNTSTFNIIKYAIKSLIIISIYNTFSSINKSLTILSKFFIKTNSNFFANSLISNHVYKMNEIEASFKDKYIFIFMKTFFLLINSHIINDRSNIFVKSQILILTCVAKRFLFIKI